MKAYELLAKLRLMILDGYEDGEYVWIGKDSDCRKLPWEEESILRDHDLIKEFNSKQHVQV